MIRNLGDRLVITDETLAIIGTYQDDMFTGADDVFELAEFLEDSFRDPDEPLQPEYAELDLSKVDWLRCAMAMMPTPVRLRIAA
jgi:hypothetical protein